MIELVVLSAALIVCVTLVLVAVVKTVRRQGWGRRGFTPSALPWFAGGLIGLVATLLLGLLWFAP